MEQAQHRDVYHYREARMIEDGSPVWVDDLTFDATLHEELAPAEAPTE